MFSTLPDRWKIILQILFVLILIAALLAVVAYLIRLNPVSSIRNIHFQVEASGGFSIITLQAGDVLISKPSTVSTPWQRTVQVPSGSEVYLTASNPSQTGALSCKISLDGKIWKEETTVAPKDGVACAGLVP